MSQMHLNSKPNFQMNQTLVNFKRTQTKWTFISKLGLEALLGHSKVKETIQK